MSPDRRSVPAAVERVREYLRRRVIVAAVLWGTAGLWVALALAWLLAGPEGWQQGSATPLAIDLLVVGLVAALAAIVVKGTRIWLEDVRLARVMESSAGLEDGVVEGTLQLARELPPGVSPSLSSLAQRSVAERLNLPEARLSGSFGDRIGGWVKRGSTTLALATPLILLLLVSEPARSKEAWSGLGRPLRLLVRPTLPPLQVSPGTVDVLRASPVDVVVKAQGRTDVTLSWQAVGDVAHAEKAIVENGEARFHFPSVTAAIEYSVTADGSESDVFKLTPVDPLIVNEVGIELTFPAYTGRPSEEYREDIPPLEIPMGTKVHIEGHVTLPLTEARLERDGDGLRVPLEAAGLGFTGNWTPTQGGTFQWKLTDRGGRGAEVAPPPLEVTVVPDSAPKLRFTFPAADTVLPLNLRQPLVLEVRDDYGVQAMELVAYRVTSLGERQEPVVQRTELGGSRAVLARPVMDFSSWGLLPGDTVRYFARAVDIAPTPRSTTTAEFVLRLPDASDLRRNAQQEMEQSAAKLQQISDRVKRASEANRDKQRQNQPNKENQRPGQQQQKSQFEQREEIQRALADQQAMSEQTDSVRAEMEKILDAMKDMGAADPTIQQKMDELNQLLEQAANSDLQEQLQQLSEGLDSAATQPQNTKALQELMKQQEKFKTQLNAAVEMMQRAIVEQDFQATTQDAREMATKQRALSDAMREGGQLQLRRAQEQDLRDAAAKLDERLDALGERLRVLNEPDARRGVTRAKTQNAKAQEAMQKAQEALPEQQPAAEQGDQAAQALDQTAQELEEAREDMSTRRAQALQNAIDLAGEESLQLARRQAQLQQRLRTADPEQLKQLVGDETSLQQGLTNLRDKLVSQDAELSPAIIELSTQMSNAQYAIDQAVTFMDSPRTGAAVQQNVEAAVQALNQMALVAIEAHQTGGDGDGEGNQIMRQLQELAQQQAAMNNQTAQLAPMELGQEALQKQLEQMAANEEQIAAELQKLAQEADKETDVLGDLNGMAKEALELAGQLGGGRLDAQTRERQEKLFHRLLDAGRTLEREEESDDRQSETAGAFERGDIRPLGAEALGALRYALPTAEQLQRLTPAERELVLRYFDRLNRGGANRGAPGGSSEPSDPAAPATPAPAAPQREQPQR